jgi:hypothetical protein
MVERTGPGAEGERSAGWAEAIDSWKEERNAFVSALAPLEERDWQRLAGHPHRGPFQLAALVREWLEEDLEQLAGLHGSSEPA